MDRPRTLVETFDEITSSWGTDHELTLVGGQLMPAALFTPPPPRPTWLRGFDYGTLCDRLAEGHHE